MADFDYKSIGLKALDVVVGIGSAVAGGYGGPAAAQGVQMAGGAIKEGINEATGEGERSRADKHDRADFQARGRVVQQPRAPVEPADDGAASRAELLRMGWTPEQADRIIAGPTSGVTLASLVGEESPPRVEVVDVYELERPVRRVRAQRVATTDGRRIKGGDGATVKGARPEKVDESEGSSTLASLGKVISSVVKS